MYRLVYLNVPQTQIAYRACIPPTNLIFQELRTAYQNLYHVPKRITNPVTMLTITHARVQSKRKRHKFFKLRNIQYFPWSTNSLSWLWYCWCWQHPLKDYISSLLTPHSLYMYPPLVTTDGKLMKEKVDTSSKETHVPYKDRSTSVDPPYVSLYLPSLWRTSTHSGEHKKSIMTLSQIC